jgi:hypothetical protein
LAKVNPDSVTNATGVPVSFQTSDDVALIFLKNHADLATAVANLQAKKTELKIDQIIYGAGQKALGYGDPTTDPAVPDIIIRPNLGVIYTTNKVKIAEHGGLSDDDNHVACFASAPGLKPTVFDSYMTTRRVAPTILKALGIDPGKLQGVKIEEVIYLEGF